MKYSYAFVVLLLFLVFACDKDDPAPAQTPEEVVKEEIAEKLASVSDLKEFATAFKNVELQAADVQNGITVFAPQDGSAGGRLKSGNSVSELSPEILKGHMVKGLVDAAKLKNGDTLVALDGKKLYVTVDGEDVWINGVLISGKDLVKQAKYIIHKVAQIIEAIEEPEPEQPEEEYASLTVVVRNSVKWSPENPSGQPEPGVTVKLYTSQRDYFDGSPVAEGVTDSDGSITFAEAIAETTYYIVAEKGELLNIHNRSLNVVDSVYLGWIADGVFMTQEEIQAHAVQAGAAVGNFKWSDLNGDGIINNEDRGIVPHQQIAAPAGSEAEITVFIGYLNNDGMIVKDGPDAVKTLQAARGMINAMHKTLVMMDGILSDDAPCPEATDWCAIDNFSFTPSNALVFKIWNEGYKAIGELNLLLRDVPALSFAEKEMVLHQALGLRAYAYLELAQYFGGLPIPEGIWLETESRATREEIYQLVSTDLQSVVDVLPSAPSDERYLLTADGARALLARTALLQRDYSNVANLANQIINGMRYSLAGTRDDAFTSVSNAEIVWDFSFSVPPGFQDYFYGRTFSPAIRLAEVYLMLAEAQLELNNIMESRTALSVIRGRGGMPDAQGMTQEDLRVELRDTWKVEMSREGNRFVNLVRWNIAQSVLAGSGYTFDKHSLLPIPMVVIDKNFNIYQNPGY